MGEIFQPPLIQAQSWEEAQRKINEALRQMARMLNNIYTGANIPNTRLVAGTKIDGVETGAEVNPADLSELDAAQDTKLDGIETGADVTGSNTAADTALVATETAANIKSWSEDPGAKINTESTIVAMAKLYGASDYKYVTYENSVSTTNTSYVTLPDMLITHTYPKSIALLLSITRLDTQTGGADAAYNIFHDNVAGSTIGMWSGIEAGHKQICANMLVWPLTAAEHEIRIQWKCLNGNTIYCTQRRLTVLLWKVP